MTMTQERMNTVGNDETFSDDIRALRKERAKIKSRRDDIVIFPNGDNWFVFDDDANRIFEVLGWQTSEKLMDEGAISWMNLSDEGREALLLTDLNPISLWKHAEINVAGWSSEEDYKASMLPDGHRKRIIRPTGFLWLSRPWTICFSLTAMIMPS